MDAIQEYIGDMATSVKNTIIGLVDNNKKAVAVSNLMMLTGEDITFTTHVVEAIAHDAKCGETMGYGRKVEKYTVLLNGVVAMIGDFDTASTYARGLSGNRVVRKTQPDDFVRSFDRKVVVHKLVGDNNKLHIVEENWNQTTLFGG